MFTPYLVSALFDAGSAVPLTTDDDLHTKLDVQSVVCVAGAVGMGVMYWVWPGFREDGDMFGVHPLARGAGYTAFLLLGLAIALTWWSDPPLVIEIVMVLLMLAGIVCMLLWALGMVLAFLWLLVPRRLQRILRRWLKTITSHAPKRARAKDGTSGQPDSPRNTSTPARQTTELDTVDRITPNGWFRVDSETTTVADEATVRTWLRELRLGRDQQIFVHRDWGMVVAVAGRKENEAVSVMLSDDEGTVWSATSPDSTDTDQDLTPDQVEHIVLDALSAPQRPQWPRWHVLV